MKKETNSLIRNTGIYFLGNIGVRLLTFFLLPFYTLWFSTNEFGTFDIINTGVILLTSIVGLQLKSGVFRFIIDEKNKEKRIQILSSGVILICLCSIVFLIFSLVINLFYPIKYSILIIIYVTVSIFGAFWGLLARAYQKNTLYAISGIISALISLIVVLSLVLGAHLKVEALILSGIAGQIATWVCIEVKLHILSDIKISALSQKYIKCLLNYSIPLIPRDIFWWITNMSNRYFILFFLGTSSNGLFALAGKLSTLLVTFNIIFQMAWLENSILTYNNENRNEYYSQVFNSYARLLLSVSIILIASTGLIFRYLFAEEYSEALLYTPFLYIGSAFYGFSHFYENGYLSAKKTRPLFFFTVIFSLINILFNYIFIQLWGLQGASIAFFLTYFFFWIVLKNGVKKYFRITINYRSFIILCLLSFLFSVPILTNTNSIWINVFLIIFSLLIAAFFNKEDLLRISQKIRHKFLNVGEEIRS